MISRAHKVAATHTVAGAPGMKERALGVAQFPKVGASVTLGVDKTMENNY